MEDIFIVADTIIAEIELSYQPTINPLDCPRIIKSKDAYRLFVQNWDKTKFSFVEEYRIMLLNCDHRVLGICTVPRVTCAQIIIDPRIVFAIALKANAIEIIVGCNRPSGLMTPSPADNDLAGMLVAGAQILKLTIADYLIVTTDSFYSFAFEGVL